MAGKAHVPRSANATPMVFTVAMLAKGRRNTLAVTTILYTPGGGGGNTATPQHPHTHAPNQS